MARQPAATQYNARPVMVSYGAADPNKLLRWTGAGMGEPQAFAHAAQRLFRTEQEGKLRSDPRVFAVEDVTKGLGLEDTDAQRIQQLLTETRVDVFTDPKLRSVRAPLAMTRLGEFLQKTERFTADQRMEVRRRAGAWWRKFGKPDYQEAPEARWNYAKSAVVSPHVYFGPKGGKWSDQRHKHSYHEHEVSKLKAGGKKREDLPQVPSAVMGDFLASLQKRGIAVRKVEVPVKKLKPIQSEINEEKVANMPADGPPIIISADFSVLDGHHRMVAAQRRDPGGEIKTYQVDLPIKELLREAGGYAGSKRQTIDDQSVKKALLAAAADWALLRKAWGAERPGHKYISRKPDGKGGWEYEYADKPAGSGAGGSSAKAGGKTMNYQEAEEAERAALKKLRQEEARWASDKSPEVAQAIAEAKAIWRKAKNAAGRLVDDSPVFEIARLEEAAQNAEDHGQLGRASEIRARARTLEAQVLR